MQLYWKLKLLIIATIIGILKIRNYRFVKLNKSRYETNYLLGSTCKTIQTSTANKLFDKQKNRNIKKKAFLCTLLKGDKNEEYKNKSRSKIIGIKIFATSSFFNPKKFEDLFPENAKQKGAKEELLDLDKIPNLKEINADLCVELQEYKKEISSEKEQKEKEKKETQTKEEKIDKYTPIYEGLPILMIEGDNFEGFADSRKKKICPEIATEFSNKEYEEVVGQNEMIEDGFEDTNIEKETSTKKEIEETEATADMTRKTKEEALSEFERDVKLLLRQGKEKEETNKKCVSDTLNERIEKYKKVGKHYYIESTMGEILFDRNNPGYIYFNHGENIKELIEQTSVDSEHPGYINPSNIHLRTGRKREEQKKKDSGIKQKKRWNINNTEMKDIKRGNWKYYNDTVKDLLDSTDQEKIKENYYSNNYYQRTNYNTGFGNLEKVQNYYFDAQFIGSAETYPANISVGMNFIWPINFVPLLCKQYTKRLGQPIKSELFNLGGFDSLQIWFYPDGMNNSIDGYCSIKLIMKPGSYLPVRIFFFAFSEYNYIHTAPFYKESAEYVTSSFNFCKLLLKTENTKKMIENNKDYVVLGPAGNVYIGVGIFDDHYDFDEDFKKFYSLSNKYKKKEKAANDQMKHKFQYKYDWDEGVHIFDNWLKKHTAVTDDKDELLPVYYTHSDMYENYKYRYVPEKNPFKFLNKKKEEAKWNRHPF